MVRNYTFRRICFVSGCVAILLFANSQVFAQDVDCCAMLRGQVALAVKALTERCMSLEEEDNVFSHRLRSMELEIDSLKLEIEKLKPRAKKGGRSAIESTYRRVSGNSKESTL